MLIKRQDPMTGKVNEIDLNITIEQWGAYKAGGYVQDCFPQLTADEREFIISGIPPGLFDEYCGPGREG